MALVIVLGALAGGVYLVGGNQQLQRGATQSETSAQVLPSNVTTTSGSNFNVSLWVNTGKPEDKLTGLEMTVNYDPSKLKFVSFQPMSGYTLVNDTNSLDNGSGKIKMSLVAMGTEQGGAINYGTMTFKALSGKSTITAGVGGKLMINGQSSTWSIASGQGSVVVASGSAVSCITRPICLDATPPCKITERSDYCPKPTKVTAVGCGTSGKCPEGYTCKSATSTQSPCMVSANGATICPETIGQLACVKDNIISPTPGVVNSCGKRCTSDNMCGSGQTCAPIWWPCQTLPLNTKVKVQKDTGLTRSDVVTMETACPMTTNLVLVNTQSDGSVKMPLFYGVCRNTGCVASVNCNCSTQIQPYSPPVKSK